MLSSRKKIVIKTILPYFADIGRVSFVVVFIVVAIGIIAELGYPGLVFNQISPQKLVLIMVCCGALSLFSSDQKISLWRMIIFLIIFFAIAILIILAAWNYFSSLVDRKLLTTAVALTLFIVLIGVIRFLRHSSSGEE